MKIFKIILSSFLALVLLTIVGCNKDTPDSSNPPEQPVLLTPQYTIDETLLSLDANDDCFSVNNVEMVENSPLFGMTFYWLGSSVTYGASSQGTAMAEYLQAKTGCICKKDAVSGTTIFDDNATQNTGVKSYTRRLINSTVFDKNQSVDAFICQISTNDAILSRIKHRGSITDSSVTNINQFDRTTTLGGIEFIIAYVTNLWHCPVYFYSGAYFGDSGTRSNKDPSGTNYSQLVNEVKQVAEKWSALGYEVKVIDLYNDNDFNNAVSDQYYTWCTSDPIHPKRAGYLNWWMPYFENYFIENLT